MLRPKKAIPKLAVAMLALTGCGGDGNTGTGGSGGSGATGGTGGGRGFPEGVNNFCLKAAECVMIPAQECLDEFEPYRDYYNNISDACFNLIGTYYQCLADLSCDDLMNLTDEQVEAQCYADLEQMFAEVCPP